MTVPSNVSAFAAGLAADALPAYVYDLGALRTHAAAVRAALPAGVELYYAAKANPDTAVLEALRSSVDGYEVSSAGELAHVRQAAPDAPLAFGGPGKTPAEIAAAVAAGVHRWHVESVQELYQLAAALDGEQRVDVMLRVNVPVAEGSLESVALAMGGRPSPFGLDPAAVASALALLAGPIGQQLRLRGIHAHLGSGLSAAEHLAVTEQIVNWSAALATRHGLRFDEVNVGGGMAVDYAHPSARFDWVEFGDGLGKLLDRRPELRLRIEPGRALTAYCGYYATEVLDVKTSQGEHFAVVRGGTHHLRTPATKGHDQPFAVVPVEEWSHPWPRPGAAGRVSLTGQLCTPKDLLAQGIPVAEVRAGDRIVFAMAGAYAWNISHHDFLMHPHPGFHYL
ncbi:type III PLP-dependent enzyme [Kribbella sp. NPDC058245]|uniref:type III PLP-dependent enzyme n=1 Tax=Kribbella sp. NPDC058245 TaxID=3346399 RepID=UPI0036EC5A51